MILPRITSFDRRSKSTRNRLSRPKYKRLKTDSFHKDVGFLKHQRFSYTPVNSRF